MAHSNAQIRFAKLMLSQKSRLSIYRQLERLLSNGISTHRALDEIWNALSDDGRRPGTPEAIALDVWRSNHRNGQGLAAAIQGWVPHQEQMLIEAGTLTGNLDKVLRDIIEISEDSGKIKGAMVGSFAYPCFLVAMLIGVLWLFGVYFIPPMAEIFPPERWGGTAVHMLAVSTFIQDWLLLILIATFSAFALITSSMGRWTGRARLIFDALPPWSMYKASSGIGFLLSLSALLNAGVALPDALRKIRRNANPYLAERIDRALYYVNNGVTNIGQALKNTGHDFPSKDIVRGLRVYASIDGFDSILDALAKQWMKDTVKIIEARSRVLNIAFMILLAGTIMWFGFGIYDLNQQITDAAMSGY